MEKIIVIPARYASTRLPGKPLIEISGKPIIQWVYEKASGSALQNHVIIATDDERIRDVAASFGAEAVMTSAGCKSGTDRVWEVIKDRDADIVINLQGDEPFIRTDMIDTLFYEMENGHLQMATLCSPIKNGKDYLDSNVVKVVLDRAGFALYFSRSPIPFLRNAMSVLKADNMNLLSSIGNAGCIYKHIGIYAFSRDFLREYVGMKESLLEEAESLEQLRVLEYGYDIKVLITEYNGMGIDTHEDLDRARKIIYNDLS